MAKQTIKSRITRAFCGGVVYLLSTFSIAGLDQSEKIEQAVQATVLIKTNLKHGFLEDKQASGRWTGAGFLIDKNRGWLLTNAHVAGYGPASSVARFESQDEFADLERIFVDSKHDIAVMQISSEQIPPETKALELDCQHQFARGKNVFSIGHPEDQTFTSSLGVMSGKKDFHINGSFYTTDLVTEPGSSGGPVIDLDSNKVVGMMTAKFSYSDIGYMTKPDDICRIVSLMRAGKNPSRPQLGFQSIVVDGKLSNRVGAVFDSRLDLQLGDTITAVNGSPWDHQIDGDLQDALRGYDGESVEIRVDRGGDSYTVSVPIRSGKSHDQRKWIFFDGLLITEDDRVDARFGMGNTSNPILVIQSIDSDFDDSFDIEFMKGSEIVSINRFEGLSLSEAYVYLTGISEGEGVTLTGRVFDWTPEAYSHMFTKKFSLDELTCSWCSSL